MPRLNMLNTGNGKRSITAEELAERERQIEIENKALGIALSALEKSYEVNQNLTSAIKASQQAYKAALEKLGW